MQTTEVRKEMIEIHVRIKIDTNDPREAYLQAMGALAFSGHEHVVSDYWLINGKPLPKQVAQTVKQCNGRRDNINRLDPHVQAALESLHDLAVAFTDESNPEAIGIMEELDVLVDNAIPMNPVSDVTQCVTRERCIHNEVDLDLSEPEYTPMFRRMMLTRDVDFYLGSPPIEGSTPIDFNVGTAEGDPISPVDVEIADLLCGLRQAE